MATFTIAMALAWLGAEMLILVVVRWGARCAADVSLGKPPPAFGVDRFARAMAITFLASAAALGLSATVGRQAFAGHARAAWMDELVFGVLWNALCMGWVWLEGAIALTVMRIDEQLHARAQGRLLPPRPPAHVLWLSLAWPAIAVAYNAMAIAAAYRRDFTPEQLERVLLFFLRVCGIGWIVFELLVARSGVRLFRLLSRRAA